MKGIIFTLNSKYIHSSLAPWCLYTACKAYCKEDISLTVSEGTINGKSEETLNKLLSEKPDFIAFSCYIWNKEKTLSICEEVRKISPHTIIILGGPEAAYNQKELLEKHSFIDYILSGEGEIILPKLIDCLAKGDIPEEIDGVSFRKDGEFIIRNEAIGEKFDYPTPYCEEYLNSLGGRIAYIESSRGCPYSCAYCLSGRCGKVKFKTAEQTKKEILILSNSGTKTVKFVDRTFNCSNERAVEILRFINENRGKTIPDSVCFHFEISADILKDSFIEEVSRADKGVFQFEAGIQSLNKATLEAIGRKCNTEKLFRNLEKLISLRNCHIHTDLIAGLPEETLGSFKDGFNKSYALGADMLQLGFLKLLHGSQLRADSTFSVSYSPVPPYEVISTVTLSESDLDILRVTEKEVERLHNSGRFRRTLAYALTATRLTPFDLFYSIGEKLKAALPDHGSPLDRYTDALFDAILSLNGIERETLRDVMIYDRIATNSSGIFPKSLIITDSRLKKVKNILAEAFPVAKNTDRSVAVLYRRKCIIFCDYEEKDKVTGEYAVKEIPFNFFGETFFDFDIDK